MSASDRSILAAKSEPEIADAAAEGRGREANELAHALKGVAATLGALRVEAAVSKVEALLKEGAVLDEALNVRRGLTASTHER